MDVSTRHRIYLLPGFADSRPPWCPDAKTLPTRANAILLNRRYSGDAPVQTRLYVNLVIIFRALLHFRHPRLEPLKFYGLVSNACALQSCTPDALEDLTKYWTGRRRKYLRSGGSVRGQDGNLLCRLVDAWCEFWNHARYGPPLDDLATRIQAWKRGWEHMVRDVDCLINDRNGPYFQWHPPHGTPSGPSPLPRKRASSPRYKTEDENGEVSRSGSEPRSPKRPCLARDNSMPLSPISSETRPLSDAHSGEQHNKTVTELFPNRSSSAPQMQNEDIEKRLANHQAELDRLQGQSGEHDKQLKHLTRLVERNAEKEPAADQAQPADGTRSGESHTKEDVNEMLEKVAEIQEWITVNKLKIGDIDATTVDLSQRVTSLTDTLIKHNERLTGLDILRQNQHGLRSTMGDHTKQLKGINGRLDAHDEQLKSLTGVRTTMDGRLKILEDESKLLHEHRQAHDALQRAVADHDKRLTSLDRRQPDQGASLKKATEQDRRLKALNDHLATVDERLDAHDAHRQLQDAWSGMATDHDRRLKELEEEMSFSKDEMMRSQKEELGARDTRLATLEERSRAHDSWKDTIDDHKERLEKLESLSRDVETFSEGVFELYSRVDSIERNQPAPAAAAESSPRNPDAPGNDELDRRVTEYEKTVKEQNARIQEQDAAIQEMRAQLAQLVAKQDQANVTQDKQSADLSKVEKDLSIVKLAVASQSANHGLEAQLTKCLDMAQLYHRRENFPTREHMEASAQLLACLEAAKTSLSICKNT